MVKQVIARRIVKHGQSKYLAVTQILPEKWEYVTITVNNKTPKQVNITIQPLEVS